MFSNQALNEAEELDDSILSAIEYYKGNLVSSNGTIATDESQNGKKKTFKIDVYKRQPQCLPDRCFGCEWTILSGQTHRTNRRCKVRPRRHNNRRCG